MALKIRLTRAGAKKRPFYRVVIADSRSPRDGRFVEKIGTYNPMLPQGHADRLKLDTDRVRHWLGGVMGMLPGIGKLQKQLAGARVDEKMLTRQQAILSSMTKLERRRPELIKASRKQRIAAGSGTSVPEVNRLLKQHQEMARMMKQMSKLGQKGLMRHGMQGLLQR